MKAVVLFSGGLDSTTCLALAIEKLKAENVLALSISYGQKHVKELEAARKIASFYQVQLMELDLKEIFKNSNCTLLEGRKSIPHENYQAQLKQTNGAPVSTYVPFRNGLFLSVAASVALANDCEEIYYGAHMDDAAGNAYPDTSSEFNDAINKAIYIGSGQKLQLIAPFIHMTKKEVVSCGVSLQVPYELTWSCYEGHDKACGVCATCIDRKNAFLLNHLKDPIEYEVN